MKHVPEEVLEKLLAQWEPSNRPEYRLATCWDCGCTLYFGMWHLFFRGGHREAHLCHKCFTKHAV